MQIKETQIVTIAQAAAQMAYNAIIGTTDIDRVTALCAAKDGGDEFARMLCLTLSEQGVKIESALRKGI